MLKKLFFYDFKMIGRRALTYLITALICGAVSFAITLLDFVLPEEGDLAVLLGNTLTGALSAVLLAAFVLLFLALISVFTHFYKSLFSDEGHFTLMLPATREQLLLSKILSGAAFTLTVWAVALFILLVGILLPFEILMRAADASFLTVLFRSFDDVLTVWSVSSLVIALVAQVVTVYTAITLGALLFRKRKILGAFIFYLVLSGAVWALNALFSSIFLSFTETGEPYTSLTSILISLLTGSLGYLIMKTLLRRRLNLT